MEQVGVEDHRAVLPVGHVDRRRPVFIEEPLHPVTVEIHIPKAPLRWNFDRIHRQSAALDVEVRLVRRDPEVHVHRGVIPVKADALQLGLVFVGPHLPEAVVLEDLGDSAAELSTDWNKSGETKPSFA